MQNEDNKEIELWQKGAEQSNIKTEQRYKNTTTTFFVSWCRLWYTAILNYLNLISSRRGDALFLTGTSNHSS